MAPELCKNALAHSTQVAEGEELGYRRINRLPSPPWRPPSVHSYSVPLDATGMGPVCPFALAAPPGARTAPLVFETAAPIFSAAECESVIDEARAHIQAGRTGETFSYAATSRNVAVHSLPRTQEWLNVEGLPRVASLVGGCLGENAIGDPSELRLYRALVVHYDALAGLTHQQMHRDHSLVTCVVTLNERHEYSGGGTMIEALGRSMAPERGHALVAASALRHAGHMIDAGERWAMVLFLVGEKMRFGEHVRHFTGRATSCLSDGDREGVARCLQFARVLSDDADPILRNDDFSP